MPHEQCELLLRQREDTCRDKFFMAPAAEQTKGVKPGRNWVSLAVCQMIGRGKSKRSTSGRWVLITYRCNTEVLRCCRHGSNVRFIFARVTDRLTLHKGTVANEVCEHNDLSLRKFAWHQRLRNVSWYRDTLTYFSITERTPSMISQEWMIRRRVYLTARC